MIEYRVGDVLNSNEKIVVHGCNCFHSMGAGIALQVFREAPKAWLADQMSSLGDRSKMGTYTSGVANNGTLVINAYTQFDFTRHKVDVEYDMLEKVIRQICLDFPGETISMPKIGCGLAGGDWNVVEEILNRISEETGNPIRVYTLE